MDTFKDTSVKEEGHGHLSAHLSLGPCDLQNRKTSDFARVGQCSSLYNQSSEISPRPGMKGVLMLTVDPVARQRVAGYTLLYYTGCRS